MSQQNLVFFGISGNSKTWYLFIHMPLIYFKIILPKHIFDYHPVPEKKQIGGIQDMEFEGVLKKQAEIPESIKKEVDFLGVIKKKLSGFSIGLRFLVLEFPRGVAQICGTSRGESLFVKGKVTNI